jgi:DNA-binding NtrC family response regulator
MNVLNRNAMPADILVIDDEAQLRKLLRRVISLEGFHVTEADTIKLANEQLGRQPFDVVLCDVKLPDGNGVEFVKEIKNRFPAIEVILLTAFGNIADGVQAMKNGAFDYMVKGDDNNRILPLLHQATERARNNKASAVKISNESFASFESIIGSSAAIKRSIAFAQKISATDSPVLLLGNTGTGKEVFANAIHHNSDRRKKPMVAINCSAFNRELLEGELFGHKAGAYTGAVKDKKGLIELAEEGTLFLDEIGELNIELQAKLLRFLENGEFIKLGDTKISKADVRIIAATNRNLENYMAEGHFREDLYYRLNVFTIELPSLHERKEDIAELANYFIKLFTSKEKGAIRFSGEALRLLEKYSWKGNIRELRNVIKRALVLIDGNEILPEHLPFEIQRQSQKEVPGLSLASIEKQHILKILQHTDGNKVRAADYLGIGLSTLYRKLEEYHLPK